MLEVRDAGLGFGKPQVQPAEHLGDLFFQGEYVISAAVGHDDEIVRLCRPPGYADRGVKVLVSGVESLVWSA
ncbi:hypothetical protein G352_00752 [Rhodococcus ruber BKS 20-38]|uniref:Uncharacterized protein n=1 Tax=Rhodococcus ruber BKS 20-38 TaxID=1278076 RepID=M3A331_9NOCA|nr:hypothetical protein G352_00752 [Rhodococcus ruber BKS 20-38]